MNWYEIEKSLKKIIGEIKKQTVINNTAIRDDIFNILEKSCTVIYYPVANEKTRGFHIQKLVNDKLEDFVYINSEKPIAEQIFGAAHEFGHICDVANKVWKDLGYEGEPTEDEEEDITNRFAAELLMPTEPFRRAFFAYLEENGKKGNRIMLDGLVKIIVLLMNDFLVPYESVRKRLYETKILSQEAVDYMESQEAEIIKMVSILADDQNTYLGKGTEITSIPDLRTMIEEAEKGDSIDNYLLSKVKKDFHFSQTYIEKKEIEIFLGELHNG